jgi:hypothetical protein
MNTFMELMKVNGWFTACKMSDNFTQRKKELVK